MVAVEAGAFLRVGFALAELAARAAGHVDGADGIETSWRTIQAALGLKPAPRGRGQKEVAEALAAAIDKSVRVQRTAGNQDAIERVSEAVAARIRAAALDDAALLGLMLLSGVKLL